MQVVWRPPASPVKPLEKVALQIVISRARIVDDNTFSLFPFKEIENGHMSWISHDGTSACFARTNPVLIHLGQDQLDNEEKNNDSSRSKKSRGSCLKVAKGCVQGEHDHRGEEQGRHHVGGEEAAKIH